MVSRWDLREFIPVDGIYTGSARVSFAGPDGEVSGPGTLTLLPDGHATLRIHIEEYSIPTEYHGFLMPFLRGGLPESVGKSGTTFRERGTQTIARVELKTAEVLFQATQGLISNSHFELFAEQKTWIEVIASDLQLIVADTLANEMMWCMPLFGDLAEFRGAETVCSIGDQSPYVYFEVDGNPCGLEILRATGESQANAYNGVVFGTIGSRPHSSVDEVRHLLPSGLIPALSVATGSDIRAPWLDLRSFDGRLRRRVHLRAGGNHTENGFPVFTRFDSARAGSGIGGFLNCFFTLPEAHRASLLAPLNLVRSGTPGSATVDESITDLVKALDAMCELHGLARQNLREKLNTQNAGAIGQILQKAREDLKRLRHECKTNRWLGQLAVLDKIISRQANVTSEERDFGIAVADLLRKFGLLDAEAMNAYYSGLSQQTTWEGLLSAVRGRVVHSGAIGIQKTGRLLSWFEFARHLHDISKRVMLREIGYKGTYAASNVLYTGQYELDRVKQTTTTAELGYTTPPVST